MAYPDEILHVLRMRNELDSGDSSMDDSLNKLSHRQALRECVAWELGSPDWAGFFIRRATACGYTVESNDKDG